MRFSRSMVDLLRDVGLRPTRQRLELGKLLFNNGDKHVSAENLYDAAKSAGVKVSLATIYNTLHHFKEANLLREVVIDSGRSYFDTNISDHHHFFDEASGKLIDIDPQQLELANPPIPPSGKRIARIDIIVRLTNG